MKIIINWLIFLLIVAGIVALFMIQWRRPLLHDYLAKLPTMTGPQVVAFALACAFVWVDILKWGHVKPFNCIKCLTGWFALILAFAFHVEFWLMYIPLGLFVGSLFEAIKMRYL